MPVLQRAGDHQPWQQNHVNTVVQPHDEDHPESQQRKHSFHQIVSTVLKQFVLLVVWLLLGPNLLKLNHPPTF